VLATYDDLAGLPCTSAFGTAHVVHFVGPTRAPICATAVSADGRFIDLGLVLVDTRTDLMWEKKTGADGVPNDADLHHVDNTYDWCHATGSTDVICEGVSPWSWIGAVNAGRLSLPYRESALSHRLNAAGTSHGDRRDGPAAIPSASLTTGRARRLPTEQEMRRDLRSGILMPRRGPAAGPARAGSRRRRATRIPAARMPMTTSTPSELVWSCGRGRSRLSCQLRQTDSDIHVEVLRNNRAYGLYRFTGRAAALTFAHRLRHSFEGNGWTTLAD
jgi:hypothetical protein